VTIVHKANVLPVTDGLFLSTALEVAKQFDEIFTEDMVGYPRFFFCFFVFFFLT
jgi:isocitrate dehydrogenase